MEKRLELDNQQERPRSLEYVAGLIAGEGCFSISVRKVKHARFSLLPSFSIGMMDRDTILEAARILRENDLPVYLAETSKKTLEIRATGYKRVKRYTATFIPFLTGTKKQAALVVDEFCTSRLLRKPKSLPTENEIALIEKIRVINGRPGKKTNDLGFLRDYTSETAS